jgi:hypothetical protein
MRLQMSLAVLKHGLQIVGRKELAVSGGGGVLAVLRSFCWQLEVETRLN